MRLREFQAGDEVELQAVFRSAIFDLAGRDYTAQQIEAWAASSTHPALWARRIRRMRPFVVESETRPIAYADLQPGGHIDHFYVAGPYARRGVGTLLMRHLLAAATARGLAVLTSDVSRTAQPFFARFGFAEVEFREPVVHGVVVPNTRMRRDSAAGLSARGVAVARGGLTPECLTPGLAPARLVPPSRGRGIDA